MYNGSITVLCGLPGSGKSTWVKTTGSTYVVLCPDEFRKVLTGKDFHGPAEEAVWACVKTAARVLAGQQKLNILIDATSSTIGQRAQWIKIAAECEVPAHCVWVDTPFEQCLERNALRTRQVPIEAMERIFCSFEPPTVSEGFTQVRRIDVRGNISQP